MSQQNQYMQRCLDLAIHGLGHVAPNPMVGCVLVANNQIIGEGYHQQFGEAHAEVNAILSVPEELKHLIQESTLYVNLEPCSHYGKTPPCADLIIQNKIPRVAIGSFDPNPLVSGRGIEKMRAAGIEVITDVLKLESDFLNRRFLTYYNKKKPYIILKWAQSSDGYMAPDEAKQLWLTNDESRKMVHRWRSEEQAILVGRRTVEVDNPELNLRLAKGKNPLRIVIDKSLKLSGSYKIFNERALTLVFNDSKSGSGNSVTYVPIDFEKNVLQQILGHLHSLQIQSVIVEGGANTLQHFIDQNLWDEARIFTAPATLKAGIKAPQLSGKKITDENIEGDKLEILLNQ